MTEKCINISELYAPTHGVFCNRKREWVETKNPLFTHGSESVKPGYTGICDDCPYKLLPSELSVVERAERIRLIYFLVNNYRMEINRLIYDGLSNEDSGHLWLAVYSKDTHMRAMNLDAITKNK